MTNQKKIFILIPTLTGGGAERVASLLSLAFKRRGYEIIFVLLEGRVTYPHAGRIIVLDLPGANNPLLKLWRHILRWWKLRKLIKQYRPYTVLSFMEGLNMLNVVTGHRPVIDHQGYQSLRDKHLFWNRLIIRLFYNRAVYVIVVSQVIKEALVKTFRIRPELIKVIHNPVDIEAVQIGAARHLPKDWHAFFENRVIINIGSLREVKGQLYLINAFAEIHRRVPDTRLLILGEGNLRPQLEAMVNKFGLEDIVAMPGFVKNPYVFLAHSDLFVLSSLSEGFPNVLIEALACSIPVVATDCYSGPREILAPNTDPTEKTTNIQQVELGYLVPEFKRMPGNTESHKPMVEAILAALENANPHEITFKTAIEPFKLDKIAECYLNILIG